MAKEVGSTVSLDLSSFEIVRRYKTLLLELFEKRHVDVVFCNEDEAKQLAVTVEAALILLASYCKVAVVTMGPSGCWVQSGNVSLFSPTTPKSCIDTTGAGDLFASGFLHMYMQGHSLKHCCEVGHLLGGAVLSVLGAQLPESSWSIIVKSVQQIERSASSQIPNEGNQNPHFALEATPSCH